MAWPARVAPWVLLNAPRKALPIGVRAVETITASRILLAPDSNNMICRHKVRLRPHRVRMLPPRVRLAALLPGRPVTDTRSPGRAPRPSVPPAGIPFHHVADAAGTGGFGCPGFARKRVVVGKGGAGRGRHG